MPFGALQNPQVERNLHATLRSPPASVASLDKNSESDMPPDTHPEVSPPGSPPQHQQIEHAMPLGPYHNSSLFSGFHPKRPGPQTPQIKDPSVKTQESDCHVGGNRAL